jgi:hypothetical protein
LFDVPITKKMYIVPPMPAYNPFPHLIGLFLLISAYSENTQKVFKHGEYAEIYKRTWGMRRISRCFHHKKASRYSEVKRHKVEPISVNF